MITAELKEIYSTDVFVDMNAYVPEDEDVFDIELTLIIGIQGEDGGDLFYLTVCSNAWLEQTFTNRPLLSQDGYLVIDRYDFSYITQIVKDHLATISGDDWGEVAAKIHGFARWEFDSYQDFVE